MLPRSLEATPLELRQYLDILKRHKWFIIEAVVVVALAAGILSSLRTPVYRATARVLLTPNDPTQQLNPNGVNGFGNDPDRYVAGQINIVESENVAEEALKSLQGVSVRDIETKASASQSGQSNVLKISAIDTDPVQARDIADAVAKGYIENRRQSAVSGLKQAAADIQEKLGPLQAQIAQLDGQIGDESSVQGATSTLVSPIAPNSSSGPSQPLPQVPSVAGSLGGLPTTQEAVKAARYAAAVQYETLYSRQQELLVDISLKRGDAELIAEAKTPASPFSPRPRRDAALGIFVGLLLGGGVSLLREQLNDRVRSAQEVERLTGLPLLAQLPYDESAAKGGFGVATIANPASPLSEAIRSLRTSIQYLGVDKAVKVIVVTSAAPNEGKSLVAANLAVVLAQAEYRTILISADLRRSSINDVFGTLAKSPGLTGVISPVNATGNGRVGVNGHPATANAARSQEALRQTEVPGLRLLPSGPTPPNPAELLGSQRMTTILAEYTADADFVIIDTPPLLPVTDAAVIAAKCDGVVLVTALNETRRDSIGRAKAILDGTGARVLGAVVNKSPTSGGGGYYYASYYGYTDDTSKRQKRRQSKAALSNTPVSTK